METDAKVRRLGSEIRFSYEEPSRISWVQEDGDLKSVEGSWELEDLGDGRTRVTYWLEVDLGRSAGPADPRPPGRRAASGQLVDNMPERLKRFVESDSA